MVGQRRHHQVGGVIKHLVPVAGGGDHVPGAEQEREPFAGPVCLGFGGAFPVGQLGAFPLGAFPFGALLFGALPRAQVHDELDPAQRIAADHGRTHQDRHAVPVPVDILLFEWLEGSGPAQLLQGVLVTLGPFEGSDPLQGDPPGLEVVPAVADDVQERVIGLVDLLLTDDHDAQHVRFPQPAEQAGALAQGRSTRRCSVRSANIV
jgi:hypothetical protein